MKKPPRKKRFNLNLGTWRVIFLVFAGFGLFLLFTQDEIAASNIIFLMILIALVLCVLGIVIYTVRLGIYEPKAWRKFATDIGGTFSWKGNCGYIDAKNFKGWKIRLERCEREGVSSPAGTHLYERWTEIKAPYRRKDDFGFIVEDDRLTIKSNDEPKAHALFANPRIREWRKCLPSRFRLTTEGDQQVGLLYFVTRRFIKDEKQLSCLFEFFAEMLNQLCEIGSAEEKSQKVDKLLAEWSKDHKLKISTDWSAEPIKRDEIYKVCPRCGSSNINKAIRRVPKSQQEIEALGFKCEWGCLCFYCRCEWVEREK